MWELFVTFRASSDKLSANYVSASKNLFLWISDYWYELRGILLTCSKKSWWQLNSVHSGIRTISLDFFFLLFGKYLNLTMTGNWGSIIGILTGGVGLDDRGILVWLMTRPRVFPFLQNPGGFGAHLALYLASFVLAVVTSTTCWRYVWISGFQSVKVLLQTSVRHHCKNIKIWLGRY